MADSGGLPVIPKQRQSKAWIRLRKLICGFVVAIGFAHTEAYCEHLRTHETFRSRRDNVGFLRNYHQFSIKSHVVAIY